MQAVTQEVNATEGHSTRHVPVSKNTLNINLVRAFLTADIGEPLEYVGLMQELLQADESDKIELWINSSGGYLSTTFQLIEAIKVSEASVVAVLCGECHSAASMIALACDEVCVLESAHMLVHTSSGGFVGKNSDMRKSVEFNSKFVDKFLEKIYKGFLTESEIKKLQSGVDFWFDADEIKRRLHARNEALGIQQEIEEQSEEN